MSHFLNFSEKYHMKIVGEIPPGYVTALQLQLLQCAVSTQLCYKVQ